MKKLNMPIDTITNKMKLDGLTQAEIDIFSGKPKASIHTIDLSDPKFEKYHRMKKIKMPMMTILNKMKMDGLSQLEMDVFCGKPIEPTKVETDPLKIASQLGLPQKPTIPKPRQQMKRIHWEPVELDKIKSSIWSKVNQEWLDYDARQFELKFQVRRNKPKLNKHELKHGVGAEKKHDENEKVTFVNPKRSQQVQIGLKSFHMTNEQLRSAILTFDETVGYIKLSPL